MTTIKKITESKYFLAALGILGCFIAAVIIFTAGVHVGEHRARYSYQWGENYERNFVGGPREMIGGPRGFVGPGGPVGMMRDFEGSDFRNGHGIAGIIISIAENSIIIRNPDGKENAISVNEKTIIKDGPTDIKIADLKNAEKIVVVGKPGDNGVIDADLIRVFDNNFKPKN